MLITPPFGRLLTAMVTPFKPDLSIDWAGVEKLANHLISTGHDGIVVNGTTGEAPTTSDDEKLEIIKVVKKAVAGKAKVIAGAGNNETSHSVEQAKWAADAGADGLLVVTPYYNKPNQAGLFQHFAKIANEVAIDQILYNVPSRTGCDLKNDTVLKLSDIPNIVGIKDATGDITRGIDLIKRLPAHFSVISGDDATALSLMLLGGKASFLLPQMLPLNLCMKCMHVSPPNRMKKQLRLTNNYSLFTQIYL